MSPLNRKRFLQGAIAVAASAGLSACAKANESRKHPNVLLVLADEWRAQAFGHRGDANARTPALDRFFGEAASFTEAIAGTSVCCPARASLITGQYPLTHGVYINDVPLAPAHVTFGQAFANAGYRTGYIGKWHLYGSPEGRYERRLSYVPPDYRFGFEYWKACECTHNYRHSLYYDNDDPTPKYWPGYDAIAQTDDALRFMRDSAKEADPFCLVLSWGPPHFPYMAPREYARLYENRDLVLRPNVPEAAREEALQELRGYYAAIAVLDDCFGRLMDAVEELGADDTLVVFMSDHGEMAWSQGLEYKLYPWEESVRIPVMLRYPRALGRRPIRSTEMFNMPDVMPTLLGLAGLSVPAGVQGHDHSAALKGGRSTAATSAFMSLPVPITSARSYGFDAWRGVRTARYSYVRSLQGPWLLYDNASDPYQKENLIGRGEVAAIQAALETKLQEWLNRLGDEFLPPETYLKRDRLSHFIETKFPVGTQESPWDDWQSTLAVPRSQARSIDAALGELFDDPEAAAVLNSIAPRLAKAAKSPWRATMSPRVVNALLPDVLSANQLNELSGRLKVLKDVHENSADCPA